VLSPSFTEMGDQRLVGLGSTTAHPSLVFGDRQTWAQTGKAGA